MKNKDDFELLKQKKEALCFLLVGDITPIAIGGTYDPPSVKPGCSEPIVDKHWWLF
jgi:hypothetical protein